MPRAVATGLALALIAIPALAAEIALCKGGHRVTCVVDGDTIWWQGENIRPSRIDTPEAQSPRCLIQAPLAGMATEQLIGLLPSGEPAIDRRTLSVRIFFTRCHSKALCPTAC